MPPSQSNSRTRPNAGGKSVKAGHKEEGEEEEEKEEKEEER